MKGQKALEILGDIYSSCHYILIIPGGSIQRGGSRKGKESNSNEARDKIRKHQVRKMFSIEIKGSDKHLKNRHLHKQSLLVLRS